MIEMRPVLLKYIVKLERVQKNERRCECIVYFQMNSSCDKAIY